MFFGEVIMQTFRRYFVIFKFKIKIGRIKDFVKNYYHPKQDEIILTFYSGNTTL